MQNVEFKAELRDAEMARAVCRRLGAVHEGTLKQVDTYYRLVDGRLKKRECEGRATEVIFYSRADRTKPKISRYTIYTEEEARTRFGEAPLPVWVVVKKTRDLYMLENVRIHLDDVEKLGRFLEFEAVVSPRNNVAKCHQSIERLRREFGPALGEAVSSSYSDLVAGEEGTGET